jgi:adenine/guanine phosphoribosyltransferase-like PRPP-binding protein
VYLIVSMPHSIDNPAPPPNKKPDPWIFRDGRKALPGGSLFQDLRTELQQYLLGEDCVDGCGALIRAGILESALADTGSPSANKLAALTDALSSDLFFDAQTMIVQAAQDLDEVPIPGMLVTSIPEGFSFYALHPLDFGKAAQRIVTAGEPAAVIGIRSIGATLSAVVAASLRVQGSVVERITVRPLGHPYDRATHLSAEQIAWTKRQVERCASFVVVDEGPGRSGSTFLSVGEALVQAGVPVQRITFLGSHKTDSQFLCARDAEQRWSAFRFRAACSANRQFEPCTYIGAGEWRKLFVKQAAEWPACWRQIERLKFLSTDGHDFFKFEGLGPLADSVRARAETLASAGLACAPRDVGQGFWGYRVVKGSPMGTADVSQHVLEHLARYCAFRHSEFRVSDDAPAALNEMLGFNLKREFQVDFPADLRSFCGNMIVVDGRMQPHEWIRSESGQLLKTDGASHGDDHFFPGPTDIAWDLAGAAVEWELSPQALEFLLSRFGRISGDNATPRVPVFLLAYAVFRLSWCEMALSTESNPLEAQRLRSAAEKYRNRIEAELLTGNWLEKTAGLHDCAKHPHGRAIARSQRHN